MPRSNSRPPKKAKPRLRNGDGRPVAWAGGHPVQAQRKGPPEKRRWPKGLTGNGSSPTGQTAQPQDFLPFDARGIEAPMRRFLASVVCRGPRGLLTDREAPGLTVLEKRKRQIHQEKNPRDFEHKHDPNHYWRPYSVESPLAGGRCRALHDRGSMLADPSLVLFCCSAMNAAKMCASNARPIPQPSRPPRFDAVRPNLQRSRPRRSRRGGPMSDHARQGCAAKATLQMNLQRLVNR